jgi:O-antigen/teichoic acid export membrane protein
VSGQGEDIKRLRRSAASGARWTALAQATRIVTLFVQLAFLGRLLGGATDFGLFAMINVVVVLGNAFGDAGVSKAIIHFQDASRKELSSLYWLNLMAGVLVFAVAWLLAPVIAGFYNEPRVLDPLRLAAWVFPLAAIGQQFQILMERSLRFQKLSLIEVFAVVAGAVVSVLCAWNGKGVHSLVWGMLTATGLKALLLAGFGWGEWRPSLHFRPRECGRFIRFGAFQMGERLLNALGQQVDKVLIGAFMGPVLLGYYDLAYRLVVRPLQVIAPVFSRVGFPVFSRVQDDFDRLRKGFMEMLDVIVTMMTPLYAAMAVLAGPIVRIQLGPGYEPVVPLLRILSILGFLYSIGTPMGSILLARGRADVAFYLNVLRTALFTAAVIIGSRFGVEAIAWALILSAVLVQVPVGFYVRWRLIGMSPWPYLRSVGVGLLMAGVVGGASWVAVERVPWPGDIVLLAAVLPAAAALYLGLGRWWFPARAARLLTIIRS